MDRINILLPAMGNSQFFKENFYPKTLIEINGQPMIQRVIDNFNCFNNKQLITVLEDQECNEFHTDKIVSLLTDGRGVTLRLKNQTDGALCTSLMAVEYIDEDAPLIISNCDQILDVNFVDVIQEFEEKGVDCGVICFKSVHPRWSYILPSGNNVIQAAEKKPLSDQAIAGFYYYKKGNQFISAAKEALKKGAAYKEKYYISATINEFILAGLNVGYYLIDASKYHSFYSPAKIEDYEKKIGNSN